MAIYESTDGYGVDYRDEWGRRHRIPVGSRAAAEALQAQLKNQASQARAALKVFQATAGTTVLQAWEMLQAQRFVEPRTKRQETHRLQKFLRTYGGERIAELSPQTIAGHIALRAGELSPAGLYQEGRALRRLFAWAKQTNLTAANPAEYLKLPRPQSRPGIALTPEEERDLIAVMPARLKVRLLLGLDAGLSRGDMAVLTRGQVNLEQGTLDYHRLKTRQHVLVPLTRRLHAELARYCRGIKEPGARLFRVSPEHNTFLKHAILKVPFACRVHDLRHTFISKVARTGARSRIVQALAGHAPQTPTEKYDHPTLEELRAVVALMEEGAEKHAAKGDQP